MPKDRRSSSGAPLDLDLVLFLQLRYVSYNEPSGQPILVGFCFWIVHKWTMSILEER